MSETMRGVLAMIAANACFVANDALMKVAGGDMPMSEAIFLRGVTTCLVFAGLLYATGMLGTLRSALSPLGIGRLVAELFASISYLYAVVGMAIGDLVGILQFVPLAIAAGAAWWFGERIGGRHWIATLAGLTGALLIVKPGIAPFNGYTAFALLSVTGIVVRDLLTRGLPASVPALAIAATSAIALTLGGLALSLVEPWVWPSPRAVLLVTIAAIFLVGAMHWLVVAMRVGDIGIVGPFRYVAIIFAVLAGYAVWREWPDGWSWIGMAVITAAGIFAMRASQTTRVAHLAKADAS